MSKQAKVDTKDVWDPASAAARGIKVHPSFESIALNSSTYTAVSVERNKKVANYRLRTVSILTNPSQIEADLNTALQAASGLHQNSDKGEIDNALRYLEDHMVKLGSTGDSDNLVERFKSSIKIQPEGNKAHLEKQMSSVDGRAAARITALDNACRIIFAGVVVGENGAPVASSKSAGAAAPMVNAGGNVKFMLTYKTVGQRRRAAAKRSRDRKAASRKVTVA